MLFFYFLLCFSFICFPNSKFRLLHLGLKAQKPFSCLFGLSQMMPPVHKSAPAAHKFPLMHSSSPTEPIPGSYACRGKGSGPALFSVPPWQPLSPPSGCHIREILSPLRFNTSLKTSGEVSQPQPQTLKNSFLHTSLLELRSIQLSHKENQENRTWLYFKNWKLRGLIYGDL